MARFKVGKQNIGRRADIFVSSRYPEYTRSALERLFDKKVVTINGLAVKAGHKMKLGEIVQVDDSQLKLTPPAVALPIIYEDSDAIVINKPAGLLTHSKGAINDEATVASFIADKITDTGLAGNRAGIVHRLDRGTSGVIIAAKTSPALLYLQKQFSQRRTKKKYLAIVDGIPEPASAIIDVPLARNPKRPQTFYVHSQGKSAVTHYKVVEVFEKSGNEYALVELAPTTGRTHQIRVHMKYIKHPIVGDKVYGREAAHMYLHAKSLEITLPGGKRQIFEAGLPPYFEEFWHG